MCISWKQEARIHGLSEDWQVWFQFFSFQCKVRSEYRGLWYNVSFWGLMYIWIIWVVLNIRTIRSVCAQCWRKFRSTSPPAGQTQEHLRDWRLPEKKVYQHWYEGWILMSTLRTEPETEGMKCATRRDLKCFHLCQCFSERFLKVLMCSSAALHC